MAKVRCKETAADSFFGNFLYDQKVSREHCPIPEIKSSEKGVQP